MTDEQWRAVPWAAGYEVSNKGHVRSWRPRNRIARAPLLPRTLRPATHVFGYKVVTLRLGGGKARSIGVHRLVLQAFVGPQPIGCHACHNNGVPGDNRLENLRYDTVAGNMADKVAHGTAQRGESGTGAKLSTALVREIRLAHMRGESARGLARKHAVSERAIRFAVKRLTWRHTDTDLAQLGSRP